jgi:predicted RND superfamily exporter protein
MLGQGEPNHFDYAAVVATAPDMQAQRVAALLKDLRGWVAANTPEGYRARVTGVLAISNRVYELLLLGLFKSFAVALLVTAIVFCFVLRSVRLAMIALVPNLAPLVIMLGVMVVFGIDLKPSTILLFSMVLVIADDDTIQYMSRFRRRFLRLQKQGVADPHRQAALTLLRDVGLPMFVTSSAVAAGFLLLCFSEFRATANLGLVTGITLFAAVFADLFLAPVIIGWWRPPIGGATGAEASSDAPDPTSLEA